MHNHDLDSIAALAEGSLPMDRRAEAERLVETCDACREEYEAQRAALDVLATVGPARLNDVERAHLRRAVAAEPMQLPRKSRMTWLPRLAVAAAALAFAGTFGFLLFNSSIGAGDTADGAEAVAAESADAEAADTTESQAATTAAAAAAAEAPAAADTPMEESFDATRDESAGIGFVDLGAVTREELANLDFSDAAALDDPMSTLGLDSRRRLECFEPAIEGGTGTLEFVAVATLDGDAFEIYWYSNGDRMILDADCRPFVP